MVEFAIASSALLLIMFGIIEFGRVLYLYHTVANAARMGSRWAMVRGSTSCTNGQTDHCNANPTDILNYVKSVVPVAVDSNAFQITAAWSPGSIPSSPCPQPSSADPPSGSNAPGHTVCVEVDYPFKFAVPFVSNASLKLTSTSQMIISQ